MQHYYFKVFKNPMQLNGRDPTLVLSNMFSPLEKNDSNGEEDQGVQGNRSDHEENDLHSMM